MEGKALVAKGVLIGFCLAFAFFAVIHTRSSTEDKYDTWADLNDDGSVNILDITAVARAFGSNGDPSKLANATNLWELDCFYRLSLESTMDRQHAAAGNREPIACFVLVSYEGVPISNLASDNFSMCAVSTPFEVPVEFNITFGGEVGTGLGVYKFEISPSVPVAAVWEHGSYVFNLQVNMYAKAIANLNISPKDSNNQAHGVNAPNLEI